MSVEAALGFEDLPIDRKGAENIPDVRPDNPHFHGPGGGSKPAFDLGDERRRVVVLGARQEIDSVGPVDLDRFGDPLDLEPHGRDVHARPRVP